MEFIQKIVKRRLHPSRNDPIKGTWCSSVLVFPQPRPSYQFLSVLWTLKPSTQDILMAPSLLSQVGLCPCIFFFTWILIGNRPFFGHLQTPQCPSCYRVQCWFQMTAWHTTGHPSWHPSQTTTETLASDPEALSCPDVLDLIGFRGRKPLQGTSLGTHGTLPPGTVKGWGSETGYQDSCPLQKIWLYGKLGHQQWGTNWESVYGHPLLKGILPLHRKTRTRMVTRPWWGRGGRQNARKSLQGCGAPQEYARELKIACHHLQWGRFSVAFRCEGNELFPFSPILGFFGPSLLGPSASRHAPCIVA